MKVHVEGRCPSARLIKYGDRKGERIEGYDLHITRPPTDMEREKGQTGLVCKNFFTQIDVSGIPDGADADIKYESYGPSDTRIVSITLCKKVA